MQNSIYHKWILRLTLAEFRVWVAEFLVLLKRLQMIWNVKKIDKKICSIMQDIYLRKKWVSRKI